MSKNEKETKKEVKKEKREKKVDKEKSENKVIKIILIVMIAIISIVIVINLYNFFKDKEIKFVDKSSTNTIESNSNEKYTRLESDGTVVNTSKKLRETKEFDGFSISNIEFKEKDGMTELIADVTNKTEKAQKAFLADIVLYDNSENEVARIPASVVDTQPGETIVIHAKITESYTNAYDFKLDKK